MVTQSLQRAGGEIAAGTALSPAGRAYLARCVRARGTTITALAGSLGVTRKHLSNILHGRASLADPLLLRLCREVDADPFLVRALAAPRRPADGGYGALEGSAVLHGDPTEPIAGWELAED